MKKPVDTEINFQSLKPAIETLLGFAKQFGADKADAISAHGRSLSIGVREGKLEDVDNSEGKDIGLRVFVGQRQACVSSSDLSNTSLSKLAERAVAMAKLAPEDPFCGLAAQENLATVSPELDLFDPTELDADALFARAKILEQSALSDSRVQQAEGANANTVSSSLFFMTSEGFANGWRSTHHGISVSAIASDGTSMERDYDYAGERYFSDLTDPEQIGRKAAARVIARLGAKQIASGNMPILFERRVASQILSAFIGAISGPAIARGVSFLKDEMDAQVFAGHITITDNPLRVRGLGSHPWDGEGVVSKPLDIIKNGVLQSWLLNTSVGKQLGLKTTGHAARGVAAPPGVASSNTYIHAGEKSPEQLMQDIGKGLQITEMFGPSVNSNTGDFSVGIAGFAIENGERTTPVNEVTIAGNLKDMFKSLIPANDLAFKGPISSPSLLIPTMVVAGE
ncbi:MAG: modulator protein [Robiginitomaculum sp.]|nr:MAG: modulator protein [Robiginitomaculum sp.]